MVHGDSLFKLRDDIIIRVYCDILKLCRVYILVFTYMFESES